MSLAFPNISRSYDDAGHRIRFSGYDGMFEIKFYLEINALQEAVPGRIGGEREYLSAFETIRKRILAAAEKAYGRSKGNNMCTLKISDFG